MILFDTDALTYYSYGNEKIRQQILACADERIATSVITRYEVLRGRTETLIKAANEEELRIAARRLQLAEELLAAFVIVGVDEVSIGHFGRLRGHKKHKKMGRADLLIACIALAHDALLVTRNVRDFQNVPGLRIENWID